MSIKRMADSQFTVLFPVLANGIRELGNLSMSAGNHKRIAPFSSELAMHLRHQLSLPLGSAPRTCLLWLPFVASAVTSTLVCEATERFQENETL